MKLMNIIRGVSGLILLAFLALIGWGGMYLFFMDTLYGLHMWEEVLDFLRYQQELINQTVIYIGVLLFVYLVSGMNLGKPKPRKQFLTVEGDNGVIRINVQAAESFVVALQDEFDAIIDMTQRIKVREGLLAVSLQLTVREGVKIPELCQMIERKLGEVMKSYLGLSEIQPINIAIAEIVQESS